MYTINTVAISCVSGGALTSFLNFCAVTKSVNCLLNFEDNDVPAALTRLIAFTHSNLAVDLYNRYTICGYGISNIQVRGTRNFFLYVINGAEASGHFSSSEFECEERNVRAVSDGIHSVGNPFYVCA